jgi:hypothetical protein
MTQVAAGLKMPGRHEVQRESPSGLMTVVARVCLRRWREMDHVRLTGEEVDDLPLASSTPLTTHHRHDGHVQQRPLGTVIAGYCHRPVADASRPA